MIYVLEDDNSIRDLLVYTLNQSGYDAKGFEVPSAFHAACKKQLPDLLILDIMLPEEDGLSVLGRLRQSTETRRLPVILLTAKGSEFDKVRGLDAGADDYMAKPFGMMELLSRVKALLRRTGSEEPNEESRSVGALYVNHAKHLVKVNGEAVTLTLKEYDLLCLFLRNPGIAFTRDQLLDRIWGYSFDGESRTVDVHIRTLRQKLGVGGAQIETVRGIGYRLGDTP